MHTAFRRQSGVTLIEAATVLAITGVLLGAALPNADAARQRRHVEGAAAQFETDVHLARSTAASLGRTVRLDFQSGAGAACYVLHTGAAGNCDCLSPQPTCAAGEPLRTQRYAAQPVVMASNSASMLFDPTTGTVTPTATVRFTAPSGDALHQVVNLMGRVRTCSPSLAGYKAC